MNELTWLAIYKDGSTLNQFGKDGKEYLFKEINQVKLSRFQLIGNIGNYLVDLEDGSFIINKQRISFNGFKDSKFKLIYFKRIKQNLGGAIPIEITYNVGWQVAGNAETPNYQRIMQIHPDNSISFIIKSITTT